MLEFYKCFKPGVVWPKAVQISKNTSHKDMPSRPANFTHLLEGGMENTFRLRNGKINEEHFPNNVLHSCEKGF